MEYFEGRFSSAGLDQVDVKAYCQEAIDSFETEAKRDFEGPDQTDIKIKVGGHRLTNSQMGVRRGIMTLSGYVPMLSFQFRILLILHFP